MATGLGETFRSNTLNFVLRGGTAPGRVATYYISLHTADPGNDAGATAANNEIITSGTAYARQPINSTIIAGGFNTPTTADPNVLSNFSAVAYATATANYTSVTHNTGTPLITHFGLWTSSTLTTAAAYVGRGTLQGSGISVASGNTASFAASALSMTINTVTATDTTGFGQTFRENLYEYLFVVGAAGGTDPTAAAATLYVALHTADPGINGATANEATGTGYARAPFSRTGTPAFSAATVATPSVITNATTAIPFAAAGGDWSTGTTQKFFTIWKNVSGTTVTDYFLKGTITNQAILNGNTASFATSTLTTRLDQT